MARTVRDARLETRTARHKLASRHEPYWRAIDAGMHLGYRKGPRKTSWLARLRHLDGRYAKTVLGIADDVQDADGIAILDYSTAQARARAWFAAQSAAGAGGGTVRTVADVIAIYLDWYKTRRRRAPNTLTDLEYRIRAFILPDLGEVPVARLTTKRLRDWLQAIAERPARVRSRPGEQNYRDRSDDPEAGRRRQASANRVLTILKAALNHAYHEDLLPTDEPWRRVKPFQGVDAARMRTLSASECVPLVNACDEDFRHLVEAGLHSGCRYGELVRMRVGDFIADSGTVLIPESKSGKPRHVVLTEEGQDFFRTVTAGRAAGEILFRRADGNAWRASHQNRRLAEACERARISPRISFHVLRHSYASRLVMAGVPLAVVAANLGHADTRMVEKHYGHLAPSYIAETIRAMAPELGISRPGNVVALAKSSSVASKP